MKSWLYFIYGVFVLVISTLIHMGIAGNDGNPSRGWSGGSSGSGWSSGGAHK